jgi:hypothetical protein
MKTTLITVAAIAALVMLPSGIGFAIGGLLAGAYTAKLSDWSPAFMTGSAVGAWVFLGPYFTLALLTGYLLSNTLTNLVDSVVEKINKVQS